MATITGHTPEPVDVGQLLTITGTDLGSTTQVVFRSRGGSGVTNARPQTKSATQITVIVPLRSKSGNFYIVTASGNVLAPGMITIVDPFAPPPPPPAPPDPDPGNGAGGGEPPPNNNMTWGGVAKQIWNRYGVVGSVAAVAAGIHASGRAGGQMGTDVVGGAAALPRAGFDAGSKIALSLLDGVLSVLGPSGSALSGLAHKLVGTIGGVLEGGVKLAASGAKVLGTVAGLGLGAVGAVGGGVIGGVAGTLMGGVGGPMGALVGAALGAGAVAGILKAFEGLAGAVSGILEGVAKSFGVAVEVISSMFSALVDVVKDAMASALNQARDILRLSQASGWDLDTSSRAVQTGKAFGVGAGQLDNRNALVAGTMGSIYGGSGDGGVDDLRAYRDQYRAYADQGPVGLMLAQNLEGVASKSGFREAVNYDDATFNKQIERSQSLSMDPGQVEKIGQQWKSLTDSASEFADFVKTTVAEAAFPLLSQALDYAINYFNQNKEAIVKGIVDFGETVYVLGPKYLAAGITVMTHLVSGGLRWMADMASSFSGLLRGFDSGKGGFLEIIAAIAGGIDYLSIGIKGIASVFMVVSGVLHNAGKIVGMVVGGLVGLVTGALAWLAKMGWSGASKEEDAQTIAINDQVQNFRKNMSGMEWRTWDEDSKKLDKIPTTDIRGYIDNLRNSGAGSAAADKVDKVADTLRGVADKVDNFGEGMAKKVESFGGGEDKRRDDYREQLRPVLERIAGATEATAGHTKPKPPLPGGGRNGVENLLAYIGQNLVEQSYLAGNR